MNKTLCILITALMNLHVLSAMQHNNTVIVSHIQADLFTADLPRDERLESVLRQAAREAGATSLEYIAHKFSPDGVSAMLILAESHISLHYWYETGFTIIDIMTCGRCDPHKALNYLIREVNAKNILVKQVR